MTRLMVLGLLSIKPMSGYEMQQQLQMSQADRWAGILSGSIYHAIKKLTDEGMVELDALEQTGNRAKASYRLTERGMGELLRLTLETMEQMSVAYPTNLYTAMSFLHLLPAEQILKAIDKQQAKIEEELRTMKEGQTAKAKHIELPDYVKLVFENIYAHNELQIRFLEQLRGMVAKKGGQTQ